MGKKKIVPGMTLYRETYFGAGKYEIIEETVISVGKKYLYIDWYGNRYPIDKETLKYTDKNYSQRNFQLYVDKQDILDKNEKNRLFMILHRHFEWTGNINNNTLEQLREVVKILNLS